MKPARSCDHDGRSPREEREPRALAQVRLVLRRLGDTGVRLQARLLDSQKAGGSNFGAVAARGGGSGPASPPGSSEPPKRC